MTGRGPTILTDTQRQAVAEVQTAARAAERADDALRCSVLAALDAGVPRAQVAKAAGRGRNTIWLWERDYRQEQER